MHEGLWSRTPALSSKPCLAGWLAACAQSTELIGPDEYSRVITPEGALTEEQEEVCGMLAECLELRRKWLFKPAGEGEGEGRSTHALVLCCVVGWGGVLWGGVGR